MVRKCTHALNHATARKIGSLVMSVISIDTHILCACNLDRVQLCRNASVGMRWNIVKLRSTW